MIRVLDSADSTLVEWGRQQRPDGDGSVTVSRAVGYVVGWYCPLCGGLVRCVTVWCAV